MASFQKRILTGGDVRWKAVIRRKGHPMRSKTFRTRSKAEAWAKRIEVRILDGRTVPDRADETRTVDDVIGEYRRQVLPSYGPRERKKRATYLDWWSSQVGSIPLQAFRRRQVHEALRSVERGAGVSGKPVSVGTCNRYLAVLRHAFSFAQTELEWIWANPLSRMQKREPRGRVRFLDDAERDRLFEACRQSPDPRLYPLALLAVSTGARQGELMALRWRDVDFERKMAVFQRTKNGDRRATPLEGEALQVLKELARSKRAETDPVFLDPRRRSFPKGKWDEALRSAEIDDFRFHDLRHTAASYLAMSGATLAEIAEVLGHKTLAMVKRYAHFTAQHTSGVVARMNRKFLPPGR
jgi:integrase